MKREKSASKIFFMGKSRLKKFIGSRCLCLWKQKYPFGHHRSIVYFLNISRKKRWLGIENFLWQYTFHLKGIYQFLYIPDIQLIENLTFIGTYGGCMDK